MAIRQNCGACALVVGNLTSRLYFLNCTPPTSVRRWNNVTKLSRQFGYQPATCDGIGCEM